MFILRKFFQMFLGCFLICLFVFMMQFVWKHIETMVGKGLGFDILARFFFYMGVSLVPMALPMSVLLTSLLTFGNMGEQLELTAMKAAGIPLLRIMRPIFLSALILTGVSFYFQNNISPKAQMEMARMLISMKSTSPALEIPEGVFYNGIPNVNLYVERKNTATGMLYNVVIYKIDNGIENAQIVVADSAKLETTADKHFLKLAIYNGEQFENLRTMSDDRMMSRDRRPYDRETFQSKTLLIDFNTDFDLMNADDLKNLADAKSLRQLEADADSMTLLYDSIGRVNYEELTARYFQTGYASRADSLRSLALAEKVSVDTAFAKMGSDKRLRVLRRAASASNAMLTEIEWRGPVGHDGYRTVRKHLIKWHDKFASSLACLFFFFIGAPLGAIIRKGGLGISTIVSVLIFIVYYIIGVSGMKMARDGTWNITYGLWISTVIMAPIGFWLTYKSNKDSTVFNLDNHKARLMRMLGYRPKRNIVVKEVIIDDPDYLKAVENISAVDNSLSVLAKELKLGRLPGYFSMFFGKMPHNTLPDTAERLEQTIEMLSNSHDAKLVYKLNDYPIVYRHSHVIPFTKSWVAITVGLLVPVGLAIYLWVVHYRRLLFKDINKILETDKDIINRINNGFLKTDNIDAGLEENS